MSVEDDPFAFQNSPPPEAAANAAPMEAERPAVIENDPVLVERVLEAVKTVRDPEIPVNIVDLGLIYELIANKDPACPVAGEMPGQVKEAVEAVDGVNEARVKLVWTPPWDKDRMSEEAKLELGLL
jgi:metal-sulfur cluster biosynthetic enzyme